MRSEHDEQVAFIRYCDTVGVPVFAIPNGGHRHKATAGKLKAEGVRAGVPDLFVPQGYHVWNGLFIEMKTAKGRTTPVQREWIGYLRSAGYAVAVCHGAEFAIEALNDYLSTGHVEDVYK